MLFFFGSIPVLLVVHYMLAPPSLKRWFWRLFLFVVVPLSFLRAHSIEGRHADWAMVLLVSLGNLRFLCALGIGVGIFCLLKNRRQRRARDEVSARAVIAMETGSCETHNVYGVEIGAARLPAIEGGREATSRTRDGP